MSTKSRILPIALGLTAVLGTFQLTSAAQAQPARSNVAQAEYQNRSAIERHEYSDRDDRADDDHDRDDRDDD